MVQQNGRPVISGTKKQVWLVGGKGHMEWRLFEEDQGQSDPGLGYGNVMETLCHIDSCMHVYPPKKPSVPGSCMRIFNN